MIKRLIVAFIAFFFLFFIGLIFSGIVVNYIHCAFNGCIKEVIADGLGVFRAINMEAAVIRALLVSGAVTLLLWPRIRRG